VRRVVVLVLSAVALVACGASAASARPQRIVFGLGGGNIVPFRVTIAANGHVHATGSIRPKRRRLSHAKVASLSRLVRREFTGLRSRRCAGTNPDVGSDFIHAFGRTVTVQGSCEPRFHRLWSTLAAAVGLRYG
jgi:hypothetical protein